MLLNTLSDLTPGARRCAWAAMSFAALLFCMPFVLCLLLNAGFLSLANEPLAYRFFYSERIFSGETLAVGVGYSISILHHVVYAGIHLFPAVADGALETRLDLFALTTNGLLSALLCAIFLLAMRSTRLRVIDLALLVLAALMPIYGTVIMGFDYAMMADYHFLNVVLCVATLFIFQQIWQRKEAVRGAEVILLGVFVGLAMANKITMLVVTGVILVPAVLTQSLSWREMSIRSVLAGTGLIVAFFAVHLASYLGSVSKMRAGCGPGGHLPQTQVRNRPSGTKYSVDFSQGTTTGFSSFSASAYLVLTITTLSFRREFDRQARLVTIYCFAAFLACIYFIAKRPAGSTLFESTMFSFTLAAVLLTVTSTWRPMRALAALSCVAWLGIAGATFSVTTVYGQVARSRADSNIKWSAFNQVLKLAGSNPIEVIFPDNSFRHEGPFELLLKGATDFPTWNIGAGQKTIIDRYAPGMSFRHNFSQIRPEMPYGDGRVLVWFDRNGTQPLESEYQSLRDVLGRPSVRRYQPQGYSHLTMQVAVIP